MTRGRFGEQQLRFHRWPPGPARRRPRVSPRIAPPKASLCPGTGIIACVRRSHPSAARSEEHTSELQSPCNLVCRLLLEKKKKEYTHLIIICETASLPTRYRRVMKGHNLAIDIVTA